MSFRGNVDKLIADADEIVRRLRAGKAGCVQLMREYHVAYATLRKHIYSKLTGEEIAAIRHCGHVRAGKKSGFQKGHIPWSKGVKGLRHSPATEFKPGCIRGMAARKYRAIGTIQVRIVRLTRRQNRRGRKPKLENRKRNRWIKVADGGRPQDRWVAYARHVWEQAHGPIPKGMRVVHLDGDSMNDALANLKPMTPAEAMRYQRARDPEMERRRLAAVPAAARRRWKGHRERKANLPPLRIVAHQCHACGWSAPDTPDRCPKCGGGAFEPIKRKTA